MIYRKVKKRAFTQVDNYMLLDSSISLQAKGLLMVMLSRPDEWTFYESELIKHCTNGLFSLRSAMKELIEAGYLVRYQERDGNKFGELVTLVYEIPEKVALQAIPVDMQFPDIEKPEGEKPHTSNTDSTKTDISNIMSEKSDDPSLQEFVDVYNNNRGNLPHCRSLSASRKKKIRAAYKEHGKEEALRLIEQATKHVATDKWWLEQPYGFDNLLNGTHLVSKAEKYQHTASSRSKDTEAPF